jgi:type II secretory pathway pseudopilin PulG
MQIDTTIHKAALLRLGYYLGGGAIADQQADKAAREAISTALRAIDGVRLGDGGSFASADDRPVTLELTTAQIARAVHKLRDGQWPALSDAQLALVAELTTEVDGWLKEAQASEAWAKLPKAARDKIAKGESAALDAALGGE